MALAAAPVPALAQGFSVDFTLPTLAATNVTVYPGADFTYSTNQNVWRITRPGGGFSLSFLPSSVWFYALRVEHLTSASACCPGNGFAPVTITVNSVPLVQRHDPARAHEGVHGWVTDAWIIQTQSGDNTIHWMANDFCTHYWIKRIELVPLTFMESDLAAGGLTASRTEFLPDESLSELSVWVTNLGPDNLDVPNQDVSLELFLSRDTILNPDEDWRLGNCRWQVTLPMDGTTNLTASVEHLDQVRIPGHAQGDYHLLGQLLSTSPSTALDLDLSNNEVRLARPLHVTPPGHGIYADFSRSEIATGSMSLTPSEWSIYHCYAGGCWVALRPNYPVFYAVFSAPEAGDYWLNVRHLSSAASDCPFGGYSPVSVYVNGAPVVEDWDVAENHGGTHGYGLDSWLITAQAGENILEWRAGDLCTIYWIQRLEIVPTEAPVRLAAPVRLPSGAVELALTGARGRGAAIEESADFQTWTTLTNIALATGSVVLRDDTAASGGQRFYRAQVAP